MSKTDLSGVWGFKGTSQLAKLTELQGYREKSQKNAKPPTPPCTEPLKGYVSSVFVQNLRRDENIRLCPQYTSRGPSNSRERPRTIRSKFSPFWRNWVDSGVKRPIYVTWEIHFICYIISAILSLTPLSTQFRQNGLNFDRIVLGRSRELEGLL